MKNALSLLLAVTLLAGCSASVLSQSDQSGEDKERAVLNIAHRGASGYLPENTLPAYALAYGMGADFIELDLVMSRDGVPVAFHDLTLGETTNVEDLFPERQSDDGNWYVADLTLEELKQLNVQERFPGRYRQDTTGYQIPSFEEVIQLVQELNRSTGREVGLYPEIKAPGHHADKGLPMEEKVLGLLEDYGYKSKSDKVLVQSFDPQSLKKIRHDLSSELRLVQLIWHAGDSASLATGEGLDDIAQYADAIGASKRLIETEDGKPVDGGSLVRRAQERGLAVHVYTFRQDEVPEGYRAFQQELDRYIHYYGVEGVFTDYPDQQLCAADC